MTAPKKGIYVLRYLRALMTQVGQLDDKVIVLCTKVALKEDQIRDGRPVMLTTDYLADWLRVGRRRLIEIRNDAVRLGWLIYVKGRKDHPGEYRTAIPKWCAPQDTQSPELCEPQCAESAPESELCALGCAEPATESAPQITLVPISLKESACAPRPKTPRKTFTPPTLEQVTAYCLERGNHVDAQQWIDHYTANGWKVGRNAMKDWRAAVRTWERNGFSGAKPTAVAEAPPAAQPSQRTLDAMAKARAKIERQAG